MAPPDSFIDHLATQGYHPRSDRHSKAISEAIVADLMARCPEIRVRAEAGQLVFQHNVDLTYGHATWNTDLAIGPPPPGGVSGGASQVAGMTRANPSTVRIAVEAKSVMTEHRKAIKNRKRDLEAHHQHVHDYDQSCIAGGLVVINASPTFRSPLRPAGEITVHNHPNTLVTHCLGELNSVSMAHGQVSVGLDAKCAVVINMDNLDPASVHYVAGSPAPAVGSPINWDAFIQRICDTFRARFVP